METYLIVKTCHVISVISWLAGLLYLPRLFVYHCNTAIGSELSETLKIMERRLLWAIMNPAMIATWIFGIWLVVLVPSYLSEPWFHIKITAVFVMTLLHHVMGRWRLAFAEDRNIHTSKYFRIANELPTLGMLIIVSMVILKPF